MASKFPEIINKIQLLFDLKKYQIAINLFNNDSRLLQSPVALYHIGRCYLRLEKIERAIDLFEEALAIEPNYGAAKLELAKYYTQSNPSKAISLVNQCIQYDPLDAAYWGVLGSIHFHKDAYKEAEVAFEKCLALDPTSTRTLSNLAASKHEQGKVEAAILLYKKTISIDPNYIYPYLNLANAYTKQGKLKLAEEIYFQVMPLNPNHPTIFYGLACVYALGERTNKALDFLERSTELLPANKEKALTEKDLDSLKNHPKFIELTEG